MSVPMFKPAYKWFKPKEYAEHAYDVAYDLVSMFSNISVSSWYPERALTLMKGRIPAEIVDFLSFGSSSETNPFRDEEILFVSRDEALRHIERYDKMIIDLSDLWSSQYGFRGKKCLLWRRDLLKSMQHDAEELGVRSLVEAYRKGVPVKDLIA